MAYQKLQLKLLSKSGELLRCINCFAGQITVFRAFSSVELQPYQRALAGVPGPEKIAVSLDGDVYAPEKAVLIGFGEGFDPGQTVGLFMQSSGVPTAAMQMQLRNCGIEADINTVCESLNTDFKRRLRLLAALYAQNQVLVLNNPFEDLASNWRERFAEELCNVTQSRNMIVIVPSLNYRPECWISNDFISRIQVGQNTQRTIGFGSDPSQMNDLVQQLRSSFQDEAEVQSVLRSAEAAQQWKKQDQQEPPTPAKSEQDATPATAKPSPPSSMSVEATQVISPEELDRATKQARKGRKKKSASLPKFSHSDMNVRKYAPAAIGIVGIALFVAGGGLSLLTGGETEPVPDSVQVAQVETEKPERVASKEEDKSRTRTAMLMRGRGGSEAKSPGKKTISVPPKDTVKVESGNTKVKKQSSPDEGAPRINKDHKPNPRAKYVLDLYPASVRTSVLKSFNSSTPQSGSTRVTAAVSKEPSKTGSKSDLFSLLQSTSGTGQDLPPTRTTVTRTPPANSGSTAKKPSSGTLSREEIEERRKRIRQKFLEAIERRSQQRGL